MNYSDNIIDAVSSSWILFHITRPLLTLEDQETSQSRALTWDLMQGWELKMEGKNKKGTIVN